MCIWADLLTAALIEIMSALVGREIILKSPCHPSEP